jgi:hypothetical protein
VGNGELAIKPNWTRIHRMKWHPASSARQFRSVDQTLKPDQVAESWRTRRVKEEAGGFASISAAFGPTGQSIQGIRVQTNPMLGSFLTSEAPAFTRIAEAEIASGEH